MKKLICSLMIIVMMICMLSIFVGCSGKDDNIISSKDIKNWKGEYAIQAYNVSERVSEDYPQLTNSINIDGKYYVYYFYLGTVRSVPVYSSEGYLFNNQNYGIELDFAEYNSETFAHSVSKSTETIDTHSRTYGGSVSVGVTHEVSAEANAGIKIDGLFEVGGKVKTTTTVGIEVNADAHWTDNWGSVITDSNSTTKQYATEYSKGKKVKLDITEDNGFIKGCTYRVTAYEVARVYGVLVYDVNSTAAKEEDKYSVIYHSLLGECQKNFRIEETNDPDGYFEYEKKKSLTFNVDNAIEVAKNNIPQLNSNHRYEVINEQLSWHEAKARCEGLGGHLATITSPEENKIVKDIFLASGLEQAWLGGTDEKSEGIWTWVTGEGFGYTDWGQYAERDWEPNNGGEARNEHYLTLYRPSNRHYLNGECKWNDAALRTNLVTGFIIEYED